MFEEEAIERAKNIYTNFFGDIVAYPEVLKAIAVGVLKGADSGYNKANEWHDLRKDQTDLPKEEGEYLVIFESDGTKYKGLESYYPDTKEWSTICNILFWKEIVLPEIKESEL